MKGVEKEGKGLRPVMRFSVKVDAQNIRSCGCGALKQKTH